MPTNSPHGRTNWTKRTDRAAELAERNLWAKEILAFYTRILEFQREGLRTNPNSRRPNNGRTCWVARIAQLGRSRTEFPRVGCCGAKERSVPSLAEEAGRLRNTSQVPRLARCWNGGWLATDLPDDGSSFFARALLQPQAERLAQAAGDVPAPTSCRKRMSLLFLSAPQLGRDPA